MPADASDDAPASQPEETPSRLARWSALPALVLGGMLLVGHFLIIGISLMPDNPISHQYKYEIQDYMSPVFSQNWNLFAPNPVNQNVTLHYQFTMYENGKAETTQWMDALSPIIETKHENFWAPAQRLSKFMTSTFIDIQKSTTKIHNRIQETDSLRTDSSASVRYFRNVMRMTTGHQTAIHYSNIVFRQHTGHSPAQYDSVKAQYRIFVEEFPRFSERKLDYFDESNYEYKKQTSMPFRVRWRIPPSMNPRMSAAASDPPAVSTPLATSSPLSGARLTNGIRNR